TAIVTDENGDKMSKTKGNVIDPLDVVYGATLDALLKRADADNASDAAVKAIKKNFGKGIQPMGADALRFALAALNTTGRIRLSVDRVETYRNFINKLWNASRFALMNLDGYDPERFEAQLATQATRTALAMPERWILSRLQAVSADVDAALESFRFSDAANAIWHFIYDELCDWYIELAKPHLYQGPELAQDPVKAARRHVVQGVLATTLETTMRLLHPFAPYVTEEIWQKLPKPPQLPGSLMITVFPRADAAFIDANAEAEMQLLQQVVGACRMLRQTYNVPPAQPIGVEIRSAVDARRAIIEKYQPILERSAKITVKLSPAGEPVGLAPKAQQDAAASALVGSDVEVVMPLGGLIDFSVEKARIAKDIGKAEKEISILEKKLGNADFVAKAAEDVVAENRARLVEEQTRKQRLIDALAILGAA
ncbi:MAG: class I tRNA ligase family protein, partial [Kofleriaceae bacterium]